MQKPTLGYIVTKTILFILLNAVGICLSIMLLQVTEKSSLTPSLARTLAGGLGLCCYCTLQFRTIMGARLDGISKKDYLVGESLATLLPLVIALAVCLILGTDTLCIGFRTAAFLPLMPFVYATGNLYLGLLLQLVFYTAYNTVCYTIKQKKDPKLLGRKKSGGNV